MTFSFSERLPLPATIPALLLALLLALLPGGDLRATEGLKLPNLGESSTSLFSAEYEYQLGRTWLRIFRNRAPIVDDPLLFDYLEDLVYRLATHSQLVDRRIDLVIVDSPDINAFAVPGGVIGVHNGLMVYAQTEDELASVLAHEIAHLSQRHFSRRVEFQRNQQPLNLAAMLAGFVLLAAGGGEAGMAALSAVQAAAQDSALRYSRSNESEADRVGMQTVAAAGLDPHAAASMFERMMQASRYTSSNRIPEFLRTHPLSENRIADTRNRARQYARPPLREDTQYQLMRARVINHLAATPEEAIQKFRGELDGNTRSREASTYGLVLALTDAGRVDQAALELDSIWSQSPARLEYKLANANILMTRGEPDKAATALANELKLTPGNHPLTMAYATALMQDRKPHLAEEVLVNQSKNRPDDPGLWYLLAEVQGLSGNIVGLHQARAEYFILTGNMGEAERQLNYAMKLVGSDHVTAARLNERLRDVATLRQRMEI